MLDQIYLSPGYATPIISDPNLFCLAFFSFAKAVFYLDHNYLENMLLMFRKISAKERVVGFYSTGPSIRPNDLRIHKVVQPFAPSPAVFCIIDIRPDRPDLPVTAYKVTETVVGQEKKVERQFTHVPVGMGALEAEEIGVEHLLRDINDPTISTVASLIKSKLPRRRWIC